MLQSDDITISTSNEVIPEYNSDDTVQDEDIYFESILGKINLFWGRNK